MNPWTEERLLSALRRHGASTLERVRFRENRSTIWSVTGGGRRLNLHDGYRHAPERVVLQFAVLVREILRPGGRKSETYRRAAGAVRAWRGLRPAVERVRRRQAAAGGGPRGRRGRGLRGLLGGRPRSRARRASARPGPCCATPEQRRFLRALYRELSRTRFDGLLPDDLHLRLSRRMTSRLGQMLGDRGAAPERAAGRSGGVRSPEPSPGRRVVEIALSLDLMLPGNEDELVDTLLHEMAHAADWLRSGGRGHGPTWKAWARRVGCADRASCHVPVLRRRRTSEPVERVPDIDFARLALPPHRSI